MKTAYRTDIHWDLSAMPAGAVGMSTYGVGDIHLDSTASAELLAQGYFFGGKIHR